MQKTSAEVYKFAPVNGTAPRPFWSVMVPTYNRTDLLLRTLGSLLAQDPGPEQMQIEVVDNASTEVDVPSLIAQVDGKGRIGYFRQHKNIGAFRNFHTCIDRARG